MKALMILALTLISLTAQSKTIVSVENDQYGQINSAVITLRGEEAKNMWDFLSKSIQYSGSFVAEDAGMGKAYLNAPGIQCVAINQGHLERSQRKVENIYSCSIEFGQNGAVKL